jgi:hypothetical protein
LQIAITAHGKRLENVSQMFGVSSARERLRSKPLMHVRDWLEVDAPALDELFKDGDLEVHYLRYFVLHLLSFLTLYLERIFQLKDAVVL